MKPPTVFGLREQGAMLLALERLAELPAPPFCGFESRRCDPRSVAPVEHRVGQGQLVRGKS